VTAQTARAVGLEVVVQPREYTVAALTNAIRDYFVVDDKRVVPLSDPEM
jgi:hypothetical protein